MTDKNAIAKRKKLNLKELIIRGLSSRAFPFVTAAVLIVCYYLSLDIVSIAYAAVCGTLMLVLLDDLTPLVGMLPFADVLISYKHSSSHTAGGSDYFFQPAVLAVIAVLAVMVACAVVYRFVKTFRERRFKPTPVLLGLCALAAAFLLNGAFVAGYKPLNLMYGAMLAFLFLAVFALLKDNIKIKGDTFEKIALAFIALSILLIIELIVSYFLAGKDELLKWGTINRDALTYGWGMYNTMGMLLVMCLPSALYLAYRYRRGYLFTVYAFVLAIACVFSLSRQAMLGAVIVFPLCLIFLLRKREGRLANLLVICGFAVVALAAVIWQWEKVAGAMSKIFANVFVDGEFNGSSRNLLYRAALEDFVSAPVFGVGFFGPDLGYVYVEPSDLGIMPYFYHNTLLQMMGSCGFIGLLAYLAHRVQTVISYLKSPTVERSYIAVTVLGLLVLSLIDLHMFNIFPNLIYSGLLAVFIASEPKNPRNSKRQPFIIKRNR